MESQKGILPFIGKVVLIINSIFALYTAGFGLLSATDQRGLHWLLLSASLFLLYKPKENKNLAFKTIGSSVNFLFLVGAVVSGIYLLVVWEDRVLAVGGNPFWDVLMGLVMIVITLEATRRNAGNLLAGVTLFFIVYALYGPHFPGLLAHRGITVERFTNFLYLTTEGIYGIPLGISATYIIVFVLFGAFLEQFGGGKWFIDISYALTGRFRGGPAKTAVISSGLMGMISGAPVANVTTTGTFTIPLMKKVGFKPAQAGAVEAVASTGGMITPPIMGAGAFIMAEYLNVPYTDIVIAAILPAILFYLSILLSVDSISVKQGLVGSSKSELPSVKEVMKERGHLAIPLIFLVAMIAWGWSPMKTAFWASILTIAIAFYKSETKPNLKSILAALESGSKGVITIAAACASAGIIVGAISITGLGSKLSFALIDLSQGNVILALLLTMVITIILGFGMPPTAVYIILVAIVVPPLVDLGVSPLAAHMFLFFFSSFAALTPPVAITAYAAAAIAKEDANKTGFASFRLALIAYIIPFMFVFSPSLLLKGGTGEIILSIITAIIGVMCLVGAIEGYFIKHWSLLPRLILAISALLFLDSGWITDSLAVGGIISAYLIQNIFLKKSNQNPTLIEKSS